LRASLIRCLTIGFVDASHGTEVSGGDCQKTDQFSHSQPDRCTCLANDSEQNSRKNSEMEVCARGMRAHIWAIGLTRSEQQGTELPEQTNARAPEQAELVRNPHFD